MRPTLTAARNVLGGILIAMGVAFASTNVIASCGASTFCSSGALAGYTIECGCGGPGDCDTISEGSLIRCKCWGFDPEWCDCNNGCHPGI